MSYPVIDHWNKFLSQIVFAYENVCARPDKSLIFDIYAETDNKGIWTMMPHDPGDFVSVHFRHFIVRDDYFERLFFNQIDCGDPILATTDDEAFGP